MADTIHSIPLIVHHTIHMDLPMAGATQRTRVVLDHRTQVDTE